MSSYLPDTGFDAAALVDTPDPSGRQDTAQYLLAPDIYFTRPWLSVPNGIAFIWPIGVEGFDMNIDPTLGIHKYLGDDGVDITVTHKGQENVTISGAFPGLHSPKMMQMLRAVVYAETPDEGKLLYLPGILPDPQRVVVNNAKFGHTEGEFLSDLTYSIEFIRIGAKTAAFKEPIVSPPVAQPTLSGLPLSLSASDKFFVTTSLLNTLRKIAKAKYGDMNRWADIYQKNVNHFTELSIPIQRIPDFDFPPGTTIYL